jgi:hypothetical protein
MEDAMTQSLEVRRCTDGTIDYDFYRVKGIALRRQAIKDSLKRMLAHKFALVTVSAFVVIVLLAVETGRRATDVRRFDALKSTSEWQAAPLFRWPAGPQPETALVLRNRIEKLTSSEQIGEIL